MASILIPLPDGLKSAKWKGVADAKEVIAALNAFEASHDVTDWDALSDVKRTIDAYLMKKEEDEDNEANSGKKDSAGKKDSPGKSKFDADSPLELISKAVDDDLMLLAAQAKTVSQIAGKAEDKIKRDKSRAADLAMAKATVRAADDMYRKIQDSVSSIRKLLAAATKEAPTNLKVGGKEGLIESADLDGLRGKLKSSLRTVKTKPGDRPFVLIKGSLFCLVYVSIEVSTKKEPKKVSDSDKTKVQNMMMYKDRDGRVKKDTGKVYRGICWHERGVYTFCAPGLSSSLKSRIESSLRLLTGTGVRVRAIAVDDRVAAQATE